MNGVLDESGSEKDAGKKLDGVQREAVKDKVGDLTSQKCHFCSVRPSP
jgi:hypothetical protein